MLSEAVAAIRSRSPIVPAAAVVLGSGLGAFADEVESAIAIPYGDIPGWPQSTAVGHAGKLVLGHIEGVPLAVMAGRVHLYEGYTAQQVAFGVRVLAKLGVKTIAFTNAAGGIHRDYSAGSLVLLTDHMNLMGENPCLGPNDDSLGPRFFDMTEAYSKELRERALGTAARLGIALHQGVYLAIKGPNFETPAEIRAFRTMGADLVGMSTVPEVLAARHMGVRCLAISCVTNMAAGITGETLSHEEVLETGERVKADFARLLRGLIPELAR